MATLLNKNGTNDADILEFTANGTYHARGGNDKITIKGGSVVVYTDSGNNTINVVGGRNHTIKVASTVAAGDAINGIEELTINNADAVDAILGSGSDVIVLEKSNGRKSSGAFSAIRGGAWGDTFTVSDGTQNYQLYGEAGNDTFYINGGKNINFWGGAANDTFIIKGGSNNKVYGGDSADKFEVYADRQNLILGYGNDVVNINSGSNTKISCNLGVNEINLKSGTGHIISADIDKAASKKKGYTDAQIAQGLGLGYGVDQLTINGATNVTAHLGDGKDVVTIASGKGHKIYTEGWGDTININGGTDSLIDAGEGHNFINIKTATDVISNNTIKSGSDIDEYTLSGSGYNIDCGRGNDIMTISKGSDNTIYLGAGKDELTVKDYSYLTNTVIYGQDGDDTFDIGFRGLSSGCTIDGGVGNDTINVNWANSCKFYGGVGDDTISLDCTSAVNSTCGENNYVDAGSGNDTIHLKNTKFGVITAGTGDNVININSRAHYNYISASNGKDRVNCNYQNNIVYTGDGDDIILLAGGSDTRYNKIYCGSGNDTISIDSSYVNNNYVYGGEGNDTFTIQGNYNTCDGGAGADRFILDKGSYRNLVIGGAGSDFVGLYYNSGSRYTQCIDLSTKRGSYDSDVVNIAGVTAESMDYKYDVANDILAVGNIYIKGIWNVSAIYFGSRDAEQIGSQMYTGRGLVSFARAELGHSYQSASLAATIMDFGECGNSVNVNNLCTQLENTVAGITSTIKNVTSNV